MTTSTPPINQPTNTPGDFASELAAYNQSLAQAQNLASNPMQNQAPNPTQASRPESQANSFDHAKGMGNKVSPVAAATTVARNLLRNKILVGLVLVFIFIFTVGQFYSSNESNNAQKAAMTAATATAPVMNARPVAAPRPAALPVNANGLTPMLAQQFVTWWISKSMDYQAATATDSHNIAFQWMTPQAVKAFKETLWSPQIAAGITQGQVSAAFQPVAVQAAAINPDGSVVVGVAGTLIIQEANNATPVSQQILVYFAVRKDKTGCRISGLHNATTRQ